MIKAASWDKYMIAVNPGEESLEESRSYTHDKVKNDHTLA